MTITRLYRTPGLSTVDVSKAAAAARAAGLEVDDLATEHCFYVASAEPLDERQRQTLRWLLAETFEPDAFGLWLRTATAERYWLDTGTFAPSAQYSWDEDEEFDDGR